MKHEQQVAAEDVGFTLQTKNELGALNKAYWTDQHNGSDSTYGPLQ